MTVESKANTGMMYTQENVLFVNGKGIKSKINFKQLLNKVKRRMSIMGAKMKYKLDLYGEEGFTFEKYPSAGTVNIYNDDGIEVDMFTNYEIGDDFNKFEIACEEWLGELKEELGD